ncbi:MAG: metal-dependent hydrolase [Myxococcales bacterium]|jgi:predicted metal-dependent hydrolase
MSDNPEFRRPEGVKVALRRMKFDFEDAGFDRYWLDGSPFKSLFWTQLSTAFEPGEKFFIDSARALRGEVQDEALLDEVAEFCKQEGHHTFQHLKFDRMNAAQGIDVDRCRARYAWLLGRVRRRMDPLEMLAVTVALEHFTAGFADLFFRRPDISEGADPGVLALWAWHAAEEAEHKATAYDVYRAAGGGYFTRVTTLLGAWFMILAISMVNTVTLLKNDGKLFTRDTLRGLGYLFGRRGLVTGLVPAFFQFFAPRFHPWKEDNSADIARWQKQYASYIQSGPGAGADASTHPTPSAAPPAEASAAAG